MTQRTLIGPFKQIIPMTGLKLKGAILDNELKIIDDGGMVLENEKILAIGKQLRKWLTTDLMLYVQ